MSEQRGFFYRLHTGTGALNVIGARKRWYTVFVLALLVCVVSIVVRGFNFGIDFEGGTQIEFPAHGAHGTISTDQATHAFRDALGHNPASVQSVGSGGSASIQIRTSHLNNAQSAKVSNQLFNELRPVGQNGKPSAQAISESEVSASWGGDISRQAGIGLAVFLVLVSAFLVFYFERWMAVAAIAALINDIVITAGVYSLVGFEVTPATVIGLLTILGFSLYDTVVVFDKVKENTRGLLGLTRRTYPEAANLAVNQTLMRSINTSLIALLPVLGLLVVGVVLLGTGKLTDLALVQLVGTLSGTVSSICLATPLLVDMKMRERAFQRQAARVYERRRKQGSAAPEAETTASEDSDDADEAARRAVDARADQALAAASSVPARPGKSGESRRRGHHGQSHHGSRGQRPTGKGGRPSGKRRR